MIYTFAPDLTCLLKLQERHNGISVVNFLIAFLVYFGAVSFCVSCKSNEIDDHRFAKEEFIPVQKWYKEVYRSETIYIIKCDKGTFMVSPQKYPAVRDINEKSRVKVLVSPNEGIEKAVRFEICNE